MIKCVIYSTKIFGTIDSYYTYVFSFKGTTVKLIPSFPANLKTAFLFHNLFSKPLMGNLGFQFNYSNIRISYGAKKLSIFVLRSPKVRHNSHKKPMPTSSHI